MSKKMLSDELLNPYRELQTEDNPTFFVEYLKTFLSVLPEQLAGIRGSIERTDPKKLAQHAHAMKSSCANMGVTSMLELCQKLEEMGTQGSTSGSVPIYEELVKLYSTLKKEINELPEMAGNN